MKGRNLATACKAKECDRNACRLDFCETHYQRARAGRDLDRPIQVGNGTAVIDGKKICTKCRNWLPVERFNKNAAQPGGLHTWCKICRSESRKALYRRDPAVASGKQVWRTLKHKYGLTREQYESLLESQGGVCAICGGTSRGGRRLSVDHDHGCCPGDRCCGKCIRALLCEKCNSLLGYANDSTDRLEEAARYLRRWSR